MTCKDDPGTTHYMGCDCWETERNARIRALEARLATAERERYEARAALKEAPFDLTLELRNECEALRTVLAERDAELSRATSATSRLATECAELNVKLAAAERESDWERGEKEQAERIAEQLQKRTDAAEREREQAWADYKRVHSDCGDLANQLSTAADRAERLREAIIRAREGMTCACTEYGPCMTCALEAALAPEPTPQAKEHVLEPCDQTVMCKVCGQVEWMDEVLSKECPGPADATGAKESG